MKSNTIKNHIWWIIPVMLALAVRWTVLKNGLVYNDQNFFETELPRFKTILQAFSPNDWLQARVYYYRPFALLSLIVTRNLSGGYDPLWFHLVPYVLHTFNTALVYCLTSLLLNERRDATIGACVTACVFAVHPAQTEVVAWLSGLVETWLMVFTLISFILFVLYRRRPERFSYLLGSLLTFFLALLSKETAIMLVCIIPLYDFLLDAEISGQRGKGGAVLAFIRRGVVAWGGYICVVVVYLVLRHQNMGGLSTIGETTTFSLQQIPLQLIGAFGFYIQTLILPLKTHSYVLQLPQTLGFIAGSLFWILTFVIFAILKIPDKKLVLFHLAFFSIFLAPALYVALGTVATLPVAERYLYLPSYSYCFLIGLFFIHLLHIFGQNRYKKPLLAAAFSMVLGLFSWRSIQAARIWQTNELFLQNAVFQNPKSPIPYSSLGAYYYGQSDYTKAISYLNQAVALGPSDYQGLKHDSDKILFAGIYINLATVYHTLGNLDVAEADYERAIAIKPLPNAYFNLGRLFVQRARGDDGGKGTFYQKAADNCKKAIEMDPHKIKALYCLVQSYQGLGKRDEAERYYQGLLELDPDGQTTKDAQKILLPVPDK